MIFPFQHSKERVIIYSLSPFRKFYPIKIYFVDIRLFPAIPVIKPRLEVAEKNFLSRFLKNKK